MITESNRISAALDLADKLWPEAGGSRSELLRKILEIGISAVEDQLAHGRAERRDAIKSAAGSLSGTWPKNWREAARAEWPE